MAHHILQANIGHCAASQDLLIQSVAQWSIKLAVISEPYFVPTSDSWLQDVDGTVALYSNQYAGCPALTHLRSGSGFVAAKWIDIVIVGIYFSPNKSLIEFESFLGGLGAFIGQYLPCSVLILGDFNAKSPAWGSPVTNARGEELEEWTALMGLVVVNRGSVQTCIRQNGGSIVDITLSCPSVARRITGWRVLEEVETLSDHRYIRFEITTSLTNQTNNTNEVYRNSSKWAITHLDKDLAIEAAIVQSWLSSSTEPINIEEETISLGQSLTEICNASMPRVATRPAKRQVFWWSEEIAELRKACVAYRRRYARHRRRRNRNPALDEQFYEPYRAAKKILKTAIMKAKEEARNELLRSLDRDPWGRPYKNIRAKIRPGATPVAQTLDPPFLEAIVMTLFPTRGSHDPPSMNPNRFIDVRGDDNVPNITLAELEAAVERLKIKKTAPGPDGVPGRVLAIAMDTLAPRYLRLINACIRQGRFPIPWKAGRLVLLKKDGRPADSPSAYRPIVLLDEAGKLFERVIAGYINRHLVRIGPDLSKDQYGFREGKSTIDAILRVKAFAQKAVTRGGVAIAVSLDIANAFNTLPWECIREALVYHRVPEHLCKVVEAYLSNRTVTIYGQNGIEIRKEMSCGVPQGSVLGPLLWNIGYDWVLRSRIPSKVQRVCYADDTLVMARGDTFDECLSRITAGTATVISHIRRLGLEVALNKCEAICFHGSRAAPPPNLLLRIGGTEMALQPTIRYLGLTLDSGWNFGAHFRALVPRLLKTSAALSRLMPNTGGPNSVSRQLYSGVVRSMAIYGAPVWDDALAARNRALLRKPQRVLAIRLIRGYRTISFDAATALAGQLPWDLEAKVIAVVYRWCTEKRKSGERPMQGEIERVRAQARRFAVMEWANRLERPSAGLRTVEAVRSILVQWTRRQHGCLTFRLTQVLSGHGCFGKYLCQVARREINTRCHHCDCSIDTAQHTFEECPAWAEKRMALANTVGRDLSLSTVLGLMCQNGDIWNAVVKFCEDVMLQKEAAERNREEAAGSDQIRHRRPRRRRRAMIAQFHPP